MKHLLFLIALSACEGLTSTPKPAVSVLRQNAAGCFALVTPETPVAPELGVPDLCPDPELPKLYGGDDRVEVVIDYGPDVDFAGAADAPTPSVTITVDGARADVPVEISKEHRVGGRVYFIATFLTPDQRSSDMQITAGVDAQFQTTVSTVFQILIPPVALSLLECPVGNQCLITGAVGSAHIKVSVVGQEPQTVLVHTLLDGVPQPDTLPPVITDISQGHTEHTTATLVPAAHPGAQWMITAQLGAEPPTSVTATIIAPVLNAALSCGDPCTVAHGSTIGLTVTAPGPIRPLEAVLDTTLDGVPQVVGQSLALVTGADNLATGAVAIPVPNTPGTWQIEVSVAGYSAMLPVATVQ